MKSLSIVKRLTVAVVAAAALAGPVTGAHALQFTAGDAVLAVYGNGNEYTANIGTIQNLLTNGVNVDLTPYISQINAGGAPLKIEVFGYTGTTNTSNVLFGNADDISLWNVSGSTGDQTKNTPGGLVNALLGYSGGLKNAADSRVIFPNTDNLSFSHILNNDGSDSLGSNINGNHTAAVGVDTVLNLFEQSKTGNILTQVGTGMFNSATNRFVVSAVPVPAAVVLFATGVIGLVGVARRRMSGKQVDAA